MSGKILKKDLSRKTKIEITVVVVVLLAAIIYIIWDIVAKGPLMQLFTNRDRMIEVVRGLGPLGPIVYMLLQALQGIVAPIPSNIVGIIGGFLFSWWGVLWTTIGATLGATAVFWVSRKFGRRLVEKIIKKEMLDKFDFIIGKRASAILFLIFIIPGLPDDIVCYIAGLTDLPLRKLIAIFIIGRLPAVVSNNYIGMGFNGEGNIALVIIITIISIAIFGVFYFRQNQIIKWLHLDRKKTSKATALNNDEKTAPKDTAIAKKIKRP